MSGAAGEWLIEQAWHAYSAQDHGVWAKLFARQCDLLPGRAAGCFLRGLATLDLAPDQIPDFDRLSTRLAALTGWRVVPVAGLVPDDVFFALLASRRFPAGCFIRSPASLDYLQEPDVFHDVFGHVPMLADPVFADYLQAYGQGGLRALGFGQLHNLARLYWYTVEFGLLAEQAGTRIFGAGIISSYAETRYSLDDPRPLRLAFEIERVMRTPYRIDDLQSQYFIVPGLDELLRATRDADFAPLYARLSGLADLPLPPPVPNRA